MRRDAPCRCFGKELQAAGLGSRLFRASFVLMSAVLGLLAWHYAERTQSHTHFTATAVVVGALAAAVVIVVPAVTAQPVTEGGRHVCVPWTTGLGVRRSGWYGSPSGIQSKSLAYWNPSPAPERSRAWVRLLCGILFPLKYLDVLFVDRRSFLTLAPTILTVVRKQNGHPAA